MTDITVTTKRIVATSRPPALNGKKDDGSALTIVAFTLGLMTQSRLVSATEFFPYSIIANPIVARKHVARGASVFLSAGLEGFWSEGGLRTWERLR